MYKSLKNSAGDGSNACKLDIPQDPRISPVINGKLIIMF